MGNILLGKSMESEVVTKLTQNGLHPQTSSINNQLTVRTYTVPLLLANVKCQKVDYFFYQDVCYGIKHTLNDRNDTEENGKNTRLFAGIEKKYALYRIDKQNNSVYDDLAYWAIISNHPYFQKDEDITLYADPQTLIVADKLHAIVSYLDRELLKAKLKTARNEILAERHFFGCQLGTTTRREAQYLLYSEQGAKLERSTKGSVEKIVSFAGAECVAKFHFVSEQFYNVSFQFRTTVGKLLFDFLKKEIKKIPQQKTVSSDKFHFEIETPTTLILLHGEANEKGDITNLILTYTDIFLLNKKEGIYDNEL